MLAEIKQTTYYFLHGVLRVRFIRANHTSVLVLGVNPDLENIALPWTS